MDIVDTDLILRKVDNGFNQIDILKLIIDKSVRTNICFVLFYLFIFCHLFLLLCNINIFLKD